MRARSSWERAAIPALLATLSLLAPALASAADNGYLRYRMPREPNTLDPSMAINENAALYAVNLFDGLVEYNPEGTKVVPAVAQAWTESPDHRTYTFHLRPGVKFHNGRDVVAADVVFSLRRIFDPAVASPLRSFLDMIDGSADFAAEKSADLRGVRAPDPRTVVITLEYPYPPFLSVLASQAGNILPAEVYSDPAKTYLDHPVGCGPFRFESKERGVSLTLSAFRDHWKGPPGIPGIVFRYLPDVGTAFLEFKAGNLDYDNEAPPGQREEIGANMKESYHKWMRLATSFLAFNFDSGAFKSNAALRRAIGFAIDRERIAGVLQEGKDIPATRLLPPGLSTAGNEPGPYRYDPVQAKKLLAEAGYPEGKGLPDITMVTSNNTGIVRYSEAIQADLAAVGIRLKLKPMEFAAYQAAVEGTKETGMPADLIVQIWFADYLDPDAFFRPLLHTSSFGSGGNYGRYSNPEIDKLLDSGRRETDPAKRTLIYRKVEDIALADAGLLPIYFYFDDALVGPKVRGFVPSQLGDYAASLELLHLDR
ncbi:MAG: ABC transporter substrate-binding protein [Acidobacteria bacterium]|nr:ABC transporter substrate-binding protein [Acidobacteriota bacterium]